MRYTKASQLVEEGGLAGKHGREINSEVFILHTRNLGLKRHRFCSSLSFFNFCVDISFILKTFIVCFWSEIATISSRPP